jgi:hypothetical protein
VRVEIGPLNSLHFASRAREARALDGLRRGMHRNRELFQVRRRGMRSRTAGELSVRPTCSSSASGRV